MAPPTRDLLRSVRLFSSLDDAELDRLAAEFRERRFDAGDTITGAGDDGLTFFVIDEGEATVSRDGVASIRLGAGESFGEIALIDRGPRTATVTAATELRTYFIPIWSFRPFVTTHPDIAWKLLETLAARLREAQGDVSGEYRS